MNYLDEHNMDVDKESSDEELIEESDLDENNINSANILKNYLSDNIKTIVINDSRYTAFLRPIIKEQILKDYAICALCKKVITTKYSSNYNLDRHIDSQKHFANTNVKEKKQKIIDFFKPKLSRKDSQSIKKDIGVLAAEVACRILCLLILLIKKGLKAFVKL
jgi:hypothetical protein